MADNGIVIIVLIALIINFIFSIYQKVSEGDSFFLNFFKGLVFIAIMTALDLVYYYYYKSYPFFPSFIVTVLIFAGFSAFVESRKEKSKNKGTPKKEEIEEDKLDFTLQAYWIATVVCTAMYLFLDLGLVRKPTGITSYVVGVIVGVIVYIGYIQFRRSRIAPNIKLSKGDVGTAFLASAFAQWGVIIAIILSPFIGTKFHEVSKKDVYYVNCTDARAKGAAPIYRGQPGYRPALDRDNDGIACEP
jgi:hypothetical protein